MTFIAPADSKLKRPDNPNLPPLAVWLVDNVFDKYISLQHAINRNAIIDGDTIFMHFAVRRLVCFLCRPGAHAVCCGSYAS